MWFGIKHTATVNRTSMLHVLKLESLFSAFHTTLFAFAELESLQQGK